MNWGSSSCGIQSISLGGLCATADLDSFSCGNWSITWGISGGLHSAVNWGSSSCGI